MANRTTREQLEALLETVERQFERLLQNHYLTEITPKQRERLIKRNRSLHARILKSLQKLEHK